MKQGNIVILAKKENKREGEYYEKLYLNKANPLGQCFGICQKLIIDENKDVYAIEEFTYYTLHSALLSFYYGELKQIFDEKLLNELLKYQLKTYENCLSAFNEVDTELLTSETKQVSQIWKKILEWYNEDKIIE